ncbi:MAG TPA: sigma factor [Acidimicrobiales bacterium]|nr:sigma factor [Acidimicrobiales bacterium]
MPDAAALGAPEIGRVFRQEYGRAVAVLVRVFGDIDVAEDAVQDAFTVAMERWPSTGIPTSPAGWIITTARHRAIDRVRRESSRKDRYSEAARLQAADEPDDRDDQFDEEGAVGDDQLRLIFTCCHPSIATGAQVALTLRLLGGLTTAEIARGVSGAGADHGPAAGPRQRQDPRRRDPVAGAAGGRPTRSAPVGAGCHLPHLQRRPHRQRRRPAHP